MVVSMIGVFYQVNGAEKKKHFLKDMWERGSKIVTKKEPLMRLTKCIIMSFLK